MKQVRPGTGVTPSDQLMKIFQAGLKQIEVEDMADEKLKLHAADDADGLDLGNTIINYIIFLFVKTSPLYYY